jgi:hypothetical protein
MFILINIAIELIVVTTDGAAATVHFFTVCREFRPYRPPTKDVIHRSRKDIPEKGKAD